MQAGTEERFDAFVAANRDRAIGFAWRMLGGDGSAAEDVAQEAFLRAHRGIARFRGDASLSTWSYRILVNEVQRHRRWSWVRQRRAAELPEEIPDTECTAAPDPALQGRIAAALDKLPKGQRQAFILVHLEGFTLREAAEISGKAAGTMKSHLHRALKTPRSELGDLARGEESTS